MSAPHIVAADHPSLERDIERFLDRLRAEPSSFGPTASLDPKPYASLVASLGGRGGFRLAATECGQIIGLVRVDGGGGVSMAVAAEHRGRGLGAALGQAALERAIVLAYRRLVLHSRLHGRATRRVGESLGCVVVDDGRGRTDVIIDVPTRRSA
jgi:GNAT superfamily N-acetyltransferase